MSDFSDLDLKGPATIEAVIEAVVHLSAYDEAQVQEFVAAGRLSELFPFSPLSSEPLATDFVAEDELVEASPFPLDDRKRKMLIQSSMEKRDATLFMATRVRRSS